MKNTKLYHIREPRALAIFDFVYTLLEALVRLRGKEDLDLFLNLLQPKKEDIILDVGAGTGWIADRVADVCDDVYAVEPNMRRLSYIIRKHAQVKAFPGLAESIPFPESYFTKVFAIMSFHHVEDQDQALEEFNRIIKPDGLLLFQESNPRKEGENREYMEKLITKSKVIFLSPDALQKKLESHGFRSKAVTRARRGYFLAAEKAV